MSILTTVETDRLILSRTSLGRTIEAIRAHSTFVSDDPGVSGRSDAPCRIPRMDRRIYLSLRDTGEVAGGVECVRLAPMHGPVSALPAPRAAAPFVGQASRGRERHRSHVAGRSCIGVRT